MEKIKLGVFYWHNPTRLGNLELINKLRQKFEIVIISNENIPYIQRYGDHIIIEQFDNVQKIKKKLKTHKEKYGLDGIITLSEGAVTLMADIATEFDLIGNNSDATRVARNKYLMRENMRKVEIPQPDFYRVYSLDEALELGKKYFNEKKFFLKPPCIGGSSYCSIIDNLDHLKEIWYKFFEESRIRTKKDPLFEEQFGKDGKDYYMLIEELLGGTQFEYDDILGPHFPVYEMSVEGFIKQNKTFVYSMTDKLLPRDCRNAEEYMWRMHSRIPSQLKKILAQRVSTINKSLKAICGCSHTEFRIEETEREFSDIEFEGRFYRARLIETALRPGGAFMQSAISMATGFNSIRAMAYQACGINHEENVLYRYPMIMANLWADKPGRLVRIGGLDRILSLKENLASFHLYDGIGDIVNVPPQASRGIADAVIFGRNINLLDFSDWEIKNGNSNLYKKVEKLYLKVVDDFRPIVG